MPWPEPLYSKSQVRRAGKAIRRAYERDGYVRVAANIDSETYRVVENWRSSHGAVLNTAQAWLRRIDHGSQLVVGQRLKRYDTIVDKISTGRAKDLSTMHDIAGVRAIFRTEEDLRHFQELIYSSRARHSMQHDPDKYDYIETPKVTGYRGVHHVFKRQSVAVSGGSWNDLKFEVQLRTAVQHAWATAVEVYDSTSHARFKFEHSENPAYTQFLHISDLLARVHEGRVPQNATLSDEQVVDKILGLEEESGMVAAIDSLVVADNYSQLKKNSILVRTNYGELKIYQFNSLPSAIETLPKIEAQSDTQNAVLVRATTPSHIRVAFRNYFDDTEHFVALLEGAMGKVSGATFAFRHVSDRNYRPRK